MSSSAAAAQFKLDANSNAIALIADVASLPLPLSPTATTTATATGTTTTTTTPADRVEWSRSTILNFIEDYRRQRVLWDPNTKGYHIKQTKYEALKLLSQKYGTEIRSIRSKIKSLRSSFHREHGKVLSGRGRGVIYQPMWFAYEAIRFILDGERDQDQVQDPDPDGEAETEADEKLTLMHSLDLEQLKADKLVDRDIILQVEQQQQQHDELTARIAATVAAVAAAAAAANARDRERERERDERDDAGDLDTAREMELEEAAAAGAVIESSSAAVVSAKCVFSFQPTQPPPILHVSLGLFPPPRPLIYYYFLFFRISLELCVCVCASGLTCFAAAASTRAAVAARRRRRRCLAVRQQQRRNRWRTVGPEIGIGEAIRWSLHTLLGYFRHNAALIKKLF